MKEKRNESTYAVEVMYIFLSVVMFLKRKRMANVLCLWN